MTTAFLHFFFLASFCWVLTEAWQSYMAVTGKVRTRLIRKRFLCLGWGRCRYPPSHFIHCQFYFIWSFSLKACGQVTVRLVSMRRPVRFSRIFTLSRSLLWWLCAPARLAEGSVNGLALRCVCVWLCGRGCGEQTGAALPQWAVMTLRLKKRVWAEHLDSIKIHFYLRGVFRDGVQRTGVFVKGEIQWISSGWCILLCIQLKPLQSRTLHVWGTKTQVAASVLSAPGDVLIAKIKVFLSAHTRPHQLEYRMTEKLNNNEYPRVTFDGLDFDLTW